MINITLALSVVLGLGLQSSDLPQIAPTCFSLANSQAKIPLQDVLDLKKIGRTKDYVILPSGNYGQFKNGAYCIVTKDTPMLRGLADRFELAKHILLAGGTNQQPVNGMFPLKGSEFSDRELNTLSILIDRWGGSLFTTSYLAQAPKFLFDVRSQVTFSDHGESISMYPSIQFSSYEAQQEYMNGRKQKAGILEELDLESSNGYRYAKSGPIVSTEATEGAFCTKVFRVDDESEDLSGINATMLELVDKIYKANIAKDRLELLSVLKPFRDSQSYLYPNIDQSTLSEDEQQKNKRMLINQLQKRGYTGPEAENRSTTMKFVGRDVVIDLYLNVKKFGNAGTTGTFGVRIWP